VTLISSSSKNDEKKERRKRSLLIGFPNEEKGKMPTQGTPN